MNDFPEQLITHGREFMNSRQLAFAGAAAGLRVSTIITLLPTPSAFMESSMVIVEKATAWGIVQNREGLFESGSGDMLHKIYHEILFPMCRHLIDKSAPFFKERNIDAELITRLCCRLWTGPAKSSLPPELLKILKELGINVDEMKVYEVQLSPNDEHVEVKPDIKSMLDNIFRKDRP